MRRLICPSEIFGCCQNVLRGGQELASSKADQESFTNCACSKSMDTRKHCAEPFALLTSLSQRLLAVEFYSYLQQKANLMRPRLRQFGKHYGLACQFQETLSRET